MDHQKIEYFTKKLNSLRIKEATYNASGYKTPTYIVKEMRLAEIALNKLKRTN